MDSSSSFLANLLSWQINPLKDPLFKPMEGFVQGDFYIQEQELLTFSYIFFFIIVHPHVSEFSFRPLPGSDLYWRTGHDPWKCA